MKLVDLGDHLRRYPLLLHEGLFVRFRVLVLGTLFVELSVVDFEHGSCLVAFENLLEKVLFYEGVVCIGLHRISEVLLLIKDLDESLAQLTGAPI